MAFVYNENLALSKILMSKKNPSGKYSLKGQEVSYDSLNKAFNSNLKELTHNADNKFDYFKYSANKLTIYQLLSETLTEINPKNVIDTYGMFADVTTIAQGDTKQYTKKVGKTRAKQFITRVALAGRYEVFELAEEKFSIQTTAYGGAARLPIEEMLDGHVQWSDYLDIINEGMTEAVYKEIALALVAAINKFPATNKVSSAGFDEAQFDRLLQTVSVYGDPTIYCTLEAAMTLIPSNNWISDGMKDERWRKGYFTMYKTTPVVILPQSFTDETNTVKVIDPQMIYIFPNTGEKAIKIIFEGKTLVEEFKNRDWSTEIQTYQKFGVAVLNTNHLAVFKNLQLSKLNTPGVWS